MFPIEKNGTGCLTRFDNDRKHFERCKKSVCFLFQSQPPVCTPIPVSVVSPRAGTGTITNFCVLPIHAKMFEEQFIILDPEMKLERDQHLFPCKRPRKVFEGLKGFAFRIHQDMDLDDALCVWAGAECSFNNMVDFVAEHARSSKTNEYQFAITGFVSLLPRRISQYAFPTVSFLESQVFILGRSEKHHSIVSQSFHTVFNAFQLKTWVILIICVASLLCLMFVVSAVFSTPCTFLEVILNVFGERGQSLAVSPLTFRDVRNDESRDKHKLRLMHRGARLVLGIACSAFCIITILFYEISAVNFIFNRKPPNLGKDVSRLRPDELSQYAVPKATAQESVWRRAGEWHCPICRLWRGSNFQILTVVFFSFHCAKNSRNSRSRQNQIFKWQCSVVPMCHFQRMVS